MQIKRKRTITEKVYLKEVERIDSSIEALQIKKIKLEEELVKSCAKFQVDEYVIHCGLQWQVHRVYYHPYHYENPSFRYSLTRQTNGHIEFITDIEENVLTKA